MRKISLSAIFIKEYIISPLSKLIRDSRAVGIILMCCTFFSLLAANSSWSENYTAFWDRELHFASSTALHLPHSILHMINDGCMVLFFFLMGLEIKRELIEGELAGIKKSLLPVIAALGGMIVPALIYTLWCGSTPYHKGWGIPMATDIAFSLGILSLLGKRAPLSLRIFLTALAIIDDLGGILTIAVFYAGHISYTYLLMAAGVFTLLIVLNLLGAKQRYLYLLPGILLWYLVYNSGVHATIAGVLLAFSIPLPKINKLEHVLHIPVNFIILPLFALANTAIILPQHFSTIFTSVVHHGIFTGLVLGKPIGIFLFSMLAVRMGLGELPGDMKWKQLAGVGMIAGVGFTMSLFITTLAFDQADIQLIAKVAIITSSSIAGMLGFLYLRFGKHTLPVENS